MKWCLCMLLALLTFAGCGTTDPGMERAMGLRENLLQCDGCSFDAVITADYGEKLYTFTLNCQTDALGNLSFTVSDPKTIAGITGEVSEDGGALTFDDQVLAFETLADDQITPVSAPWLLIKTLRSGYLRACSMDDDLLRVVIDDSYEEEALQLDIWVDNEDAPVAADILWQGRRVVSLEVRNFQYT